MGRRVDPTGAARFSRASRLAFGAPGDVFHRRGGAGKGAAQRDKALPMNEPEAAACSIPRR